MFVEVSNVEWWLRDSDGVLISLYVLVIQQALASLWEFIRLDAPFRYWLGWLRSVGYCWLLWSSCPYLQLRHSVGSCGCTPTPTCKVWERHRLLILTLDGPIIINSLIFTAASHHYNKVIDVSGALYWLFVLPVCLEVRMCLWLVSKCKEILSFLTEMKWPILIALKQTEQKTWLTFAATLMKRFSNKPKSPKITFTFFRKYFQNINLIICFGIFFLDLLLLYEAL